MEDANAELGNTVPAERKATQCRKKMFGPEWTNVKETSNYDLCSPHVRKQHSMFVRGEGVGGCF